jgi:hypothetical protein
MENGGIFMAIWHILWQPGIVYGHMVHFSNFGILCQEKSGNPGCRPPDVRASRSAE